MKKIEKKILHKVYQYEARQTVFAVFFNALGLVLFGGVVFYTVSVIIRVMEEQKTWDVLEIFSEDLEVIRQYWTEVAAILYEELPKDWFVGFIIASGFFVGILFLILKNIPVLYKKIACLLKEHD